MHLSREEIVSLAIEIFVKVGLLALVLYYAFAILRPFITLTLWGVIIAVALFPLVVKLQAMLSIRRSRVVIGLSAAILAFLVVPSYMLSDSAISSSSKFVHELQSATFVVPEAPENVKEWPVVGSKVYGLWQSAHDNLRQTLQEHKEQVASIASTFASFVGGIFSGVLQSVASIIIAALFMLNADKSIAGFKKLSCRILGERSGEEFVNLSALTIRSVAQGVIGIALVQGFFAFIGMAVMDVPFAWLFAFIVVFLTILQLPALIILAPVIMYVFSYADTTPATIFAVYTVIVGASDGVLKPIFLGRGLDIPMLVILLGAIGGMILSGLLGLFVGAVGLALTYTLFIAWLESNEAAKD